MRARAFSVIQSVMRRVVSFGAARFFAILAIVAQVLLPGTLAVAASNGIDVSRFICAPSAKLSAEEKAAIEQVATLLGEEAPDGQPFDGHCPLCTLVHVAPLAEPAILAAPAEFTSVTDYLCYEPGDFVRNAQGPPLGSRGPPRHL